MPLPPTSHVLLEVLLGFVIFNVLTPWVSPKPLQSTCLRAMNILSVPSTFRRFIQLTIPPCFGNLMFSTTWKNLELNVGVEAYRGPRKYPRISNRNIGFFRSSKFCWVLSMWMEIIVGAYSWWVINHIILRIACQREYHLGQPINTEQSTIYSIGFYANL